MQTSVSSNKLQWKYIFHFFKALCPVPTILDDSSQPSLDFTTNLQCLQPSFNPQGSPQPNFLHKLCVFTFLCSFWQNKPSWSIQKPKRYNVFSLHFQVLLKLEETVKIILRDVLVNHAYIFFLRGFLSILLQGFWNYLFYHYCLHYLLNLVIMVVLHS